MYEKVNIIYDSIGHNGFHPDIDRRRRHLKAGLFPQGQFVLAGFDVRDQNHAVLVLIDVHAGICNFHGKLLPQNSVPFVIDNLYTDIALHRTCKHGETAHWFSILIHLIICILACAVRCLCIKERAVLHKCR